MTAKKPTKSIASLLNEEAEAIDVDRDAPIANSKVTRGNGRSKTLQIRLNPEELEDLERVAAGRGLPTSTLARDAILHVIRPGLARSQARQRLIDGFAEYLDHAEAGDNPPRHGFMTALGNQFSLEYPARSRELVRLSTACSRSPTNRSKPPPVSHNSRKRRRRTAAELALIGVRGSFHGDEASWN
ncbi:hypothetical protein ACAG25_23805 [Mycobacterium sp. pV006]|uniref:hypothetical protein n=1 Tax=Mycobacterium sp. pV006 TaxID=3238983 RepID=UPI00351ABBD1